MAPTMLWAMLLMALALLDATRSPSCWRACAVDHARARAQPWVRKPDAAWTGDDRLLRHGRLRLLRVGLRTASARSRWRSSRGCAGRRYRVLGELRRLRAAPAPLAERSAGRQRHADEAAQQARSLWIGSAARPPRRRRGAGAERVPVATSSSSSRRAGRRAAKRRTSRAFRIGGMVEEGSAASASRQLTVQLHRHRHRAATFPSLQRHPARPLQGRQGRGRAGQARRRTACSSPAKCWPSTTRTTCRPKRRSSRASARGRRARASAVDGGSSHDARARPFRADPRAAASRSSQGTLPLARRASRPAALDGARAAARRRRSSCSSRSRSRCLAYSF